ncbi:MAG: jadS [Amycolatopsis sp.]|jgi:MGT family glycosyltransferase|uniref:glycosyltransferase n=1 Tax=Amycolatopsis sp. TaxID=37632 RepID=UPI00260C388A|nr:nucleotide disphospho-sugar-binding domain-containing protein [Amycolatopsis sp.]MCU1681339.1 jadS [Amycolatopsis sp.]
MAGWVGPLWLAAGLEPDDNAGLYRYGYLDPVPTSLQPTLGPAAGCARPVRPTVPGSADDGLPPWAERLGNRPVVYVSLGTVPIFNQPGTFSPILEALGTEDIDVVVTVGNTNDPAEFGQLPANIHFERWLSLAALLPLCDAVVCHGGAGTTLAHGLPLVLLPRGADQFPTAAACRRAGAAQVITPREVSADAIHSSVHAVVNNSDHRDAAVRLQEEIETMPSVESAARELVDIALNAKRFGTPSTRWTS